MEEENQELAQGRGNIYNFLAILFLQKPTEELISKVVSQEVVDNLTRMFDSSILQELKDFAMTSEKDYQKLELEYDALFNVPLGKYVTPNESVYKTGLVWQLPTAEVNQMYKRAGLEVALKEMPDHIGLELNFLAFLCNREKEMWQKGDLEGALSQLKIEWEFLEKHLSTWVDDLCKNILEKAETNLYKGLAKITRAYVAADFEEVNSLLEEASKLEAKEPEKVE